MMKIAIHTAAAACLFAIPIVAIAADTPSPHGYSSPQGFNERASKPASGDWTMWGGTPHRNMVSAEKNPPTEWDIGEKEDPKDDKNIKWEAALGSKAYGNPVVSNGKVFVGTNNEGKRDPMDVPLSEKVELCLRAEGAMRHEDVKITEATVRAQREERIFMSSEGADVHQEFVECGGGIDALGIRDGKVQIRSYPSAHGGSSSQSGWEYVEGLDMPGNAPRVAEEAAALLRADPCPSGVTTIVLDSEQMVLQVHESVGHPTELDRVYGTEAAYAGTSFLKPGDLGSLRYGSDLMNITADSTTQGGLGTFAYDDEGVPAGRQPVVEGGVLNGFLSSRETASLIGAGHGGSMRADGWGRMPLVPMTNLHLEPGEGSFDDLLADVDDGIFMCTNKSWSIDDKRLNFQFGTQIAWEIKSGKLGRMLRDATYMGTTPIFWSGLDAVAGPDEWELYGLTNCGKGQPGQHAHVSHGTSPGRFRNVQVGVRDV